MSDFRFSLSILTGSYDEQVLALQQSMAAASTAAMDDVVRIVKADARADIARAGFSARWQNALRVVRYPRKGKQSIDSAAFLYHNIVYAGVFEDGATVQGSPMLWVPLANTPRFIGRQRLTPERYATTIGDLVSFTSKRGLPLLGAVVRVSGAKLTDPHPKLSLSLLKRQQNFGGRGKLRTVPLFFGIRQTKIPRKLNIRQICAAAQSRIPALYAANFKGT